MQELEDDRVMERNRQDRINTKDFNNGRYPDFIDGLVAYRLCGPQAIDVTTVGGTGGHGHNLMVPSSINF